ncbi:hypothetical protein [Leptospira idonii]|uniref:Uncharacterized protein n=1 Tax=Leptospira idonii TaxID=1193500 RepID=A0A4R9LX08_9LEPT|nr:hypothetical protein [Leptospira idonii]TGN18834.1 hypothetical protein EHS15_11850 [Leptospira idonii]
MKLTNNKNKILKRKIFLHKINSCFAKDSYFANNLKIDIKEVRTAIFNLEKDGKITIHHTKSGERRLLPCDCATVNREMDNIQLHLEKKKHIHI